MKKKLLTLGFIGCGNMAKAIINGIVRRDILSEHDIGYYDPYITNISNGINKFDTLADLMGGCRYIIIAVKPNIVPSVVKEISKYSQDKAIGSIAAGVTSESLLKELPKAHILRIMPNTCAAIGESYTCFSLENNLTELEIDFYKDIFNSVGKVEFVKEELFDVSAALCSCGVAFGHMLVESMADGGVICGMNKAKALEMATYAIKGACDMILTTGEKPMDLKDKICSPGGMTAKSMQALENGGFRASTISAIEAAYLKGKSMS